MPARTLEKALDELQSLRPGGDTPELRKALHKALQGRQSLLAAKAAKIAVELRLLNLAQPMQEAFGRFMQDPLKHDKGCSAKLAIVQALDELEVDAEAVYLAGLRHVQPEPVWGGSADTAGLLRGVCAAALVRSRYPHIMPHLVDLLMDPDRQARGMAARALAGTGRIEAPLLLRLKLLAGDAEPDVMAECFSALIALEPADSVPFLARFLAGPDESLVQAAALALGESREESALQVLLETWRASRDVERMRMLLLPIALVRRPAAVEFLLSVIEQELTALAAAAVEAMGIYQSDEAVWQRVCQAARQRKIDVPPPA